jgi:hypothetical protein
MEAVTGIAISNAPRKRPVLLALVIAALVIGIFGMHGMVAGAGRSMGKMGEHATTAPAAQPMSSPDLSTSTAPHTPAATGVSASTKATSLHAGSADMGDMLMLCVAVLTAGAGALLAALRLLALRRQSLTGLLSPRRTGVLLRLVASDATTGPPPVWEFSVIRC